MEAEVLARCIAALPGWAGLTVADVDFDPPKGFSSFTMGVRPRKQVDPPAVLYRHLKGKENAILPGPLERDVFVLLGQAGIAAECLHADETCRIERFHVGRTMTAAETRDPELQRGVASQLHTLHQLEPEGLPGGSFFELLHDRWGPIARRTLVDRRHELPADEQELCEDLLGLLAPSTLDAALSLLPGDEPVFCHNDTYHGNVFLLDDGSVRLLDFEFSCRNHIVFDFANLFAETVMEHGLPEAPHFRIGPEPFDDDDLAGLVGAYLDHEPGLGGEARAAEERRLVEATRRALPLSDLMYAFAALPLALEPIQRIRFVPYAHQRFHRFLAAL